jgi:hypothetical protein
MNHFFYKLVPPRPTFNSDITPAEALIMREHAGYWRALLDRNKAVVLGPVLDPSGVYGIGVIRCDGESEARALAAGDPAIKAQVGFRFELHAMPSAICRS